MDIDEIADAAVDIVARHLAQVGPAAAGAIGNNAIDHLLRLIEAHLNRTPQGAHAAVDLRHAPGAPASRAHASQAITLQARQDPAFAAQLANAAQHAGVNVHVQTYRQSVTFGAQTGGGNQQGYAGGDLYQAGRDVKIKRFHIGSIRFGLGGLISAIALLAGAGGGASVLIATAISGPSVTLGQATGTWTHAGSTLVSGGVSATMDPITLTVKPNGTFTFTTALHLGVSGFGPGQGIDEPVNCAGNVTADGDHFTFRADGGLCNDFQGRLADGGNTMTIGSFAQNTQSESLTKTTS